MRVFFVVMALTILLVACGEQRKDVKDTVFAPQFKALEKARSVEDTLKQGAEKERANIETSEEPEAPEQK
ncbi:MAG TPA: hypothetical protein VEI74_04385 [Candidatus Methylomirabilis sp.]|nr:hypothetical protein [Candidatus Methylomirabilis sp.]